VTSSTMSAAVIGTTSWGTTLAILMAKQGRQVKLWARTDEEAALLQREHENKRFLAGFPFPTSLQVTASLDDAFGQAHLVLFAVPSKSLRSNARHIGGAIQPDAVVISVTKGLEMDTGLRMSQVLAQELPESLRSRICVLSGPNLSAEIAQEWPSTTVVASEDEQSASIAQAALMTPYFRVYTNRDVVGVELGGALKNVIAIGAGISDGLGYGNNTKSAFVTRGLTEITRMGVAAGANALTFAGLAGLGDLVATANSPLSRNRYLGEQLAKGKSLEEIQASMQNVAEGVDTSVAAVKMAKQLNVEMPITEATYRVLFQGLDPHQAVLELLSRAPQPEWAGVPPPTA